MDRQILDTVRRFNRIVTPRTGALDGSYLGRGRPLGLARLIFEIGPDGEDLLALRKRLNLDSGYISRQISKLAREGLVSIRQDENDRRRRRITLTPKGLAERAAYDALSDELAASFLSPLSTSQRKRLVDAIAVVERLLVASAATIGIEPEFGDDAQRCVAAYSRELNERFENGFDPGRGGYASPLANVESRMMIVRIEGTAVGCGALVDHGNGIGEIKRMWIAPEARGLGLSSRLLQALETQAIALGLMRLRLDTNRSLVEAQALYRKAGYRDIERYNDNSYADFWFEKKLTN